MRHGGVVCRGVLEWWENTAQGVRSRTRQLLQPRFAQVAGIASDKFVPKPYHITDNRYRGCNNPRNLHGAPLSRADLEELPAGADGRVRFVARALSANRVLHLCEKGVERRLVPARVG